MKILLTYSSRTGNTEKVAKAIREVAPEGVHFWRVNEAPPTEDFDAIIVGFWIDKALPNKEALDYINTIKGKKVGFFATLGAYPDSAHASKCMDNARELLKENELLGEFICQGKVDEKLVEKFRDLPKGHPHAITEEKLKRYEIASKHPDIADLEKAKEIFKKVFEALSQVI